MPYLYCEKCEGFYELQKGESPEDFDSCECGGELRYFENMYEYKKYENNRLSNTQLNDSETGKQNQNENSPNHFDNRDIIVPSSTSDKLLANSAFILLTFTIFPLTLGVEFSVTLFILCAAFGLLLSGAFYYIRRYREIDTVAGLKKIYLLCGIYFLSILGTFLLWISSDIMGFIFNLINQFPLILFTLVYTAVFLVSYLGNVKNLKVTNPLESLGRIPKFVYYIGVVLSIVWLLFVLFLGTYFIHTSTTPV